MAGGKGGSQTTQVEIPQWLEDAARANIARGEHVASIGYTPYFGPDVAALTPMQEAAMANTGQAAGAFGLSGGGMTGTEGMPQAQTFANGVRGYSSAPLYQQSVNALQQNAPGQYEAIRGMYIDPVTGAAPQYSFAPQQQAVAQNPYAGMFPGGGSVGVGDLGMIDAGTGAADY